MFRITAEKLNKILHRIPPIQKELKEIEEELEDLKEEILSSIKNNNENKST